MDRCFLRKFEYFQIMKTTTTNLTTLEEFKEKNYGKRGTIARDELESGYKAFLACLRRNNNKK